MPHSIYLTFRLAVLLFISVTTVYTPAYAGPIHDAAKSGDVVTVKQLIATGTDANEMDAGYQTALHWAADNGHLEVVRVLVKNGADINAGTLSDIRPLHNAVVGRHANVVQFLIAKGADVNMLNGQGESPLDEATDWGYRILLKC